MQKKIDAENKLSGLLLVVRGGSGQKLALKRRVGLQRLTKKHGSFENACSDYRRCFRLCQAQIMPLVRD